METPTLGYRQKWRLRRRQHIMRRVPFVVGGVIVVAVVVALALRDRQPQPRAAAWAHGDGSRGRARIALGDDCLLAVWERGAVTAHSPETGLPLWPMPFERPRELEASPTVADDCVVLGGMDGVIRCLELDTGLRRWWHPTRALIRSKPLVAGNRVYVGADNGRIYALRLDQEGQEEEEEAAALWVYPPLDLADREPILGGPALWGETVVCGSSDRTIVGLDANTGKPRWRLRRLRAPVVARATTADARAYVSTETGTVLCLQVANGDVLWTYEASGLVRVPVLVHGPNAYVLSSDGRATCLDAVTGEVWWRRRLDGRPTTSAAADAMRIYVGTSDGTVQGLTHTSGRAVWRWRPGAKPLGDVGLWRDRLFCATTSGRIFSVPTGKR